jgi:crossover junction endodeoxyribonuclease RuvC
VKSQEDAPLSNRLDQLYQQLLDVIRQFQPEEAAVEEVFMNSNPASTLKLGMARGIVLLAPVQYGLKVSEYSANRVKKSVVGVGHADKTQVESMVRLLLPTAGNVTKDAADALAVAICHAHFRTASYHIGMS